MYEIIVYFNTLSPYEKFATTFGFSILAIMIILIIIGAINKD